MTGVEYWIAKKRRTLTSLQKEMNTSQAVLTSLKSDTKHKKWMYHYIALGKALGVPVKDLLATYPDDCLEQGDHPSRECKATPVNNCVAQYRVDKNLTFQQLADLLGISRPGARKNCLWQKPGKRTLRTLAALEGLTPQEFQERFAPRGEAA